MPRLLLAGLLALLPLAPTSRAQDDADPLASNLERVRSMTREHRARLAKSLDEFDALDRPTRDAVRSFDAQLAALEPEARRQAFATLRRYHVFYQNLPDEKRRKLDAEADPARRLDLIAAFRAEADQTPEVASAVADGLQVSSLSPVRLRLLARELIVFFSLDPVKEARERSEFARLKLPAERRAYATKLIQAKAFDERAELRERVRGEQAEFEEAEAKVARNPMLAPRLSRGVQEQLKAEQQAKRKGDGSRIKDAIAARAGKDLPARPREELARKLDEQQLIRDYDAQEVAAANLDAFAADLPPWAGQSLDGLPPDAARRRLKTLYRLVFPSPEEYHPPKPAPKPKQPRSAPSAGAGTPF